MFITSKRSGYNRNGEQVGHGLFLVLFNRKSGGELRAVVRHARMRQCGHWMIGSVQVGPARLTLSGCYGGDGLPYHDTKKVVDDTLWSRLHVVPQELQIAFWEGGGHNEAGTEAGAFIQWARENLAALRDLKEVGRGK